MLVLCFFFFFSSRRRHTRSLRDWSSDLCSSDLRRLHRQSRHSLPAASQATRIRRLHRQRSEERGVGTECRSRWSPNHKKKNRISAVLAGLMVASLLASLFNTKFLYLA